MKIIRLLFISFFLCNTCSLIYGSEIIFPASQIEKGKGSINLFYSNSEEKMNFRISNRDEIKVNGNSYFSDVNNDLESKGKSNSLALKLIVNPQDSLYYWVKIGVGSYDLDIPSVTVKNNLTGRDLGWIAGFGIHSNLFPDTIVTSALAFDFGVNYSSYKLDSFSAGGANPVLISDTLSLTEIQIAILMSKKYKKFEPYGGLKVFRIYSTLQDNTTLGKTTGVKDNVGLFLGTRIKVYSKESLVLEGSFIGQTALNIGWNLEF
ncbi:MAG: hypothetical protein LHV68_10075 [Elusimicrobia bacterium]|nr:hypothetical protein [Candidatus Liberimonas magnetica]